MQYKTKKDAQRAADEADDLYCQETFCPLIKAKCNPNCAAFKPMKIYKQGNEFKLSRDHGCSAYCLKGEVY